jgi:hypothetical protein
LIFTQGLDSLLVAWQIVIFGSGAANAPLAFRPPSAAAPPRNPRKTARRLVPVANFLVKSSKFFPSISFALAREPPVTQLPQVRTTFADL